MWTELLRMQPLGLQTCRVELALCVSECVQRREHGGHKLSWFQGRHGLQWSCLATGC